MGRPKGSKNVKTLEKERVMALKEVGGTLVVEKRGRGRPPKNASSSSIQNSKKVVKSLSNATKIKDVATTAKTKRGPGRPPKRSTKNVVVKTTAPVIRKEFELITSAEKKKKIPPILSTSDPIGGGGGGGRERGRGGRGGGRGGG